MSSGIRGIGLVLAMIAGLASIAGAAETRIAVIDFQRILNESRAGKAAQEKINQEGHKMESELRSKGEELERMSEQLQKSSLVMSDETREEKEREFRIKLEELRQMRQEFTRRAGEIQMRAVGLIRQEVEDVARAFAEQTGFTLMIEKQEGGVIHAANRIEVTDEIIVRYDAQAGRIRAAE